MLQGRILVLGTLRLGLNADDDRIQELANPHTTIRQMLGHGDWADDTRYSLQTLKDNLRLFTPEVLDRINQEVARAGHVLVKKSPDDTLAVRADAFVVETNVHFPTDLSLLADAVRTAIETSADLCEQAHFSDWRQRAYHVRGLNQASRRLQQLKRSTAQDEAKREARQAEIKQAGGDSLALAESFLDRARLTRLNLATEAHLPDIQWAPWDADLAHGARQIDQIRRRLLEGERIPHGGKIFSIVQPHTAWISKGKAGVAVELGLRVAISEDQHGFLLHHPVMEHTTDDQLAVPFVQALCARFPETHSVRFDKGFHRPANQRQLAQIVELPVLPKKGKRSGAEWEREHDPRFIHLRHRHSAVESAINAWEAHGLDRCPDHGLDGVKRYVALAVVARNLHRLGALPLTAEAEQERRRQRRAA